MFCGLLIFVHFFNLKLAPKSFSKSQIFKFFLDFMANTPAAQ